MSLNLWKVAGKPVAYNPLPTGAGNAVNIPLFSDYTITLRAKSLSLATLRVSSYSAVNDLNTDQVLTNDFKTYSFSWRETQGGIVYLIDKNNNGDIIIDSIQLVQKPMQKLTLNGVDGFNSGKWTLHANTRVVDDSTLELNATGTNQSSSVTVTGLIPNAQYTLSSINSGRIVIRRDSINGSAISNGVTYNGTTVGNTLLTFTVPSDVNTLYITFDSYTWGTGTFTFKRPMLNLGSIPAPYEKKRGERMVLPVAKKNLFDGMWQAGKYYNTADTLISEATSMASVNLFPVKPNTIYSISNSLGYNQLLVGEYGASGVFIRRSGSETYGASPKNFTTGGATYFIRIAYFQNGVDTSNKVQLEEGNVATPYTPYAVQLNTKAKRTSVKARTGLSFNGTTDYFQIPSMTMDSVEIDCLIDAVQVQTSPYVLDARTGLTNGFFNKGSNVGAGWSSLIVDGVNKPTKLWNDLVLGQRTKIKMVANSSFTDDVFIFNNYLNNGSGCLKGTLYKVTCYLAGNVVAQYDFENPNNIVGTSVLQKATNLIPSFEDARWSLHVNTKVYGKDVLRLDATTFNQDSYIDIPITQNTNYFFSIQATGNWTIQQLDANKAFISGVGWQRNVATYTVNSLTAIYLRLMVSSGVIGAGSFDFIKPQLFQLDGKEGTLTGAPIKLEKKSKRTLYSKR